LIVQKLTEDRDVDFDVLARTLARLFAGRPPTGLSVSMERVVRAIVLLLRCERPAAEQLVAALLFRDQLVLYADASGEEIWHFRRAPATC
jgi:hypothetical protein